jgi:hypothetical protein
MNIFVGSLPFSIEEESLSRLMVQLIQKLSLINLLEEVKDSVLK